MSEPEASTPSETAAETLPPAETAPPPGTFTAHAGSYYRRTRYLLVVGLIAVGIWSLYDAFSSWPAKNAEDRRTGHDKVTYSDMDIAFNKALAFGLPPASVLLLIWALYNSRGQYRLEDQTLHLPGHPPIQLSQIDSLDKRKWDRKGIAIVTYQLQNGRTGKFRLDDFVYQREGIDEIFRRIEWALQHPPTPTSAPRAPATSAPPPPRA